MLNRFLITTSSFYRAAVGLKVRSTVVAMIYVCVTGGAALADGPRVFQYVNSSDSGQATVSGTSTLHDWTVTSHSIQGSVAFAGDWNGGAGSPMSLQWIELIVPVNSLKSTEGAGMDNTMYDALKIKQFPEIVFKMTAGSLKSIPSQPGAPYHFGANGELSVAGTKHRIGLDLAVTPHGDGSLTITTDVGLKMTDCGVTPPTAMLGAIKAGNVITLKATWQLTKQSPEAKK